MYAILARKNRKIKYKENPLLFLLCLADSLEPVKRGNESDAQLILEQIKIKYDHNNKKVKVAIENDWANCETGKSYVKGLEGIKTWLDIDIEYVDWEEDSFE